MSRRPKYFVDGIPDSLQHKLQADLAVYSLQELGLLITKRSPLEQMIDKATGYDKAQIKAAKFWIKHFIKHAGALGHDITNSQKALNELSNL